MAASLEDARQSFNDGSEASLAMLRQLNEVERRPVETLSDASYQWNYGKYPRRFELGDTASTPAGRVYFGIINIPFNLLGVHSHDVISGGMKLENGDAAWGVSSELGFFASDKLMIGMGLGYADFTDFTVISMNPYVRLPLLGRGRSVFYAQMGLTYLNYNLKATDYYSSDPGEAYTIGFFPGYMYAFSRNLIFSAYFCDFGYRIVRRGIAEELDKFQVEVGTFRFGFTYVF